MPQRSRLQAVLLRARQVAHPHQRVREVGLQVPVRRYLGGKDSGREQSAVEASRAQCIYKRLERQ